MNAGIIVAAGDSSRFAAGGKQFALLAGRPMLAHSVDMFIRAESVDQLIIVVRAQDCRRCQSEIVSQIATDKSVVVVSGGKDRQQSVVAGLKACPKDVDLVFVHDGARPLITADTIDLMAANINEFDGLVLATLARDTLKRVNSGIIEKTIPREEVWHAQTPQLFKYKVLERAHETAATVDFCATDDSALVELMGGRVAIWPNDEDNLKVTTTADLRVAEQIILERAKGEG